MSLLPDVLVSIVSKFSPVLGAALGGPAGGIVGSLISGALGVDMNKPDEVIKALEHPDSASKLKSIELQLSDLQNARSEASKETGALRFVRPLLAIVAMIAIFGDILLINYITDRVVNEILIIMLVSLVWDVRQIYKFYFGSGEEAPTSLFVRKKR